MVEADHIVTQTPAPNHAERQSVCASRCGSKPSVEPERK